MRRDTLGCDGCRGYENAGRTSGSWDFRLCTVTQPVPVIFFSPLISEQEIARDYNEKKQLAEGRHRVGQTRQNGSR